MTINVRVEMNSAYDLRRDPAIVAVLEAKGKKIKDAANDTLPEGKGYEMSSRQGAKKSKGRWSVRVFTQSDHAKYSNAKHNTLIRVLNEAAD